MTRVTKAQNTVHEILGMPWNIPLMLLLLSAPLFLVACFLNRWWLAASPFIIDPVLLLLMRAVYRRERNPFGALDHWREYGRHAYDPGKFPDETEDWPT